MKNTMIDKVSAIERKLNELPNVPIDSFFLLSDIKHHLKTDWHKSEKYIESVVKGIYAQQEM